MKALKTLLWIIGGFLIVAVVGRVIIALIVPNAVVSSWFRSWTKNESLKAVGSVGNSMHMIGWAYDVVPATYENEFYLRQIPFFRVLNETSHLHVQFTIVPQEIVQNFEQNTLS